MIVDFAGKTLSITYGDHESSTLPLHTPEAFNAISRLWVKMGWALKYSYNFSWMGRPVVQMPEDLLMVQEVIHKVRPDVIVETGVAHGGSSVFYASLFEIFSHGRVISIDVEIRPHNRKALEEHPLKKRITLIEGSSTAPETLQAVRASIAPNEKVMVILDSNHTKDHVLSELRMYSPLVGAGSYIVAADGNMEDLHDVPGGKPEWATDNPKAAIHEFLVSHPEFEIDPEPTRLGITYWPDGYLRRK
ncbi:MAG: cephalosporin hydroxylase family protein [Nitrososphaerales archaeon]